MCDSVYSFNSLLSYIHYLFVNVVFLIRVTNLLCSKFGSTIWITSPLVPCTFANRVFCCKFLYTFASCNAISNVYAYILYFPGHNEELILLMYLRDQMVDDSYVLFILSALLDVQITYFCFLFFFKCDYVVTFPRDSINMECLVLAILNLLDSILTLPQVIMWLV